jgi:hypothetical protein
MEEVVQELLAITMLVVEVDGRIEELMLENETTVCRVVTEEVEIEDEELIEAPLFVDWHRVSPYGPLHICKLFPLHTILHRPSVAVVLVLGR